MGTALAAAFHGAAALAGGVEAGAAAAEFFAAGFGRVVGIGASPEAVAFVVVEHGEIYAPGRRGHSENALNSLVRSDFGAFLWCGLC